jgi:hypothetical protein
MMFMPTIGIPRGHRKRAHPTGLGGSDGATGTGPTAAIHIRIPLFDQARELKLAGVRAAFQQRQDTVLAGFLGQMEKLCARADRVRRMDTMRRFHRERQVADAIRSRSAFRPAQGVPGSSETAG